MLFRVVNADTDATVVHAGRVLDNLSLNAAEDIVLLLGHRDAIRDEQMKIASDRGDIAAVLELRKELTEEPGSRGP
jgi:hypothetical protein